MATMEWVEIVEPRTKEHMYANLTTGECVWEPPPGVPVKRTDDNQWWELFDHNTSRFYYYNASSQKTVWHRPHNCDIIPLAKLQTLKLNTEVREESDNGSSNPQDSLSQRSEKIMVSSETQTSPPTPRKHHHHHRQRHSSREDRGGLALDPRVSKSRHRHAQHEQPSQSRAANVSQNHHGLANSGSRSSLDNVGRSGGSSFKDLSGSRLPPPGFMMAAITGQGISNASVGRDTGTVGTITSSISLESPSTSSHSSPTHRYRAGNGSGGPPSRDGSIPGGVGDWLLQRRDSSSAVKPRGVNDSPSAVGRSYSFLSSSGSGDRGIFGGSGGRSNSRATGGDSSLEKDSCGSSGRGAEGGAMRSVESTPQPRRKVKGLDLPGLQGMEGLCTPMIYRRQKSCDVVGSNLPPSGLQQLHNAFSHSNSVGTNERMKPSMIGKLAPSQIQQQQQQQQPPPQQRKKSSPASVGLAAAGATTTTSSSSSAASASKSASEGRPNAVEFSPKRHGVVLTSGNKQMAVITPNNASSGMRPSRSLHSGLKKAGSSGQSDESRDGRRGRAENDDEVPPFYANVPEPKLSSPFQPLQEYLVQHHRLIGYRFLRDDDEDEDDDDQEEEDDQEDDEDGEDKKSGDSDEEDGRRGRRDRRGRRRKPKTKKAASSSGAAAAASGRSRREPELELLEDDDSDDFADDEGMSAASSQEYLNDDAYPEEERETYARFARGATAAVPVGAAGSPKAPFFFRYSGGGASSIYDSPEEDAGPVASSSLSRQPPQPGFAGRNEFTRQAAGDGGDGSGSARVSSKAEGWQQLLSANQRLLQDGLRNDDSSQRSGPRQRVQQRMQQYRQQREQEPHIYSPVTEIPLFKPPAQPNDQLSLLSTLAAVAGSGNDVADGPGDGDGGVINKYVQDNLNVQKRGLFRRNVPVRELLSWSKELISQPLLVTPDKALRKDKRELFKLIQIYMSDRKAKAGMTISSVAHEIVSVGYKNEAIRDELFFLLCKQTTDNPRRESLRRGWELMAICLSFFPPKKDFAPYLKWYIQKHRHPELKVSDITKWPIHVQISHYATVSETRLDRIMSSMSRRDYQEPVARDVDRSRVQIFRPTMFGSTLEEVMMLQRERFGERKLPWVLVTLAEEVVRLGGDATLGIFREAPDHREMEGTQENLDRFLVPEWTNPLVPAALLKRWLSDLHNPLIPPELLHEEGVLSKPSPAKQTPGDADSAATAGAVAGKIVPKLSATSSSTPASGKSDKDQMNAVLSRMPPLNRLVLGYIINFLQNLLRPEKVEVHRMTAYNLAVVFTPNVTRLTATDPISMQDEALKTNAFFQFLLDNMDASFANNLT